MTTAEQHARLSEWSAAHGYAYSATWAAFAGHVRDAAGWSRLSICRACGEPYTGDPPVSCPECGATRVDVQRATPAEGR
jgi:rubrerythrin